MKILMWYRYWNFLNFFLSSFKPLGTVRIQILIYPCGSGSGRQRGSGSETLQQHCSTVFPRHTIRSMELKCSSPHVLLLLLSRWPRLFTLLQGWASVLKRTFCSFTKNVPFFAFFLKERNDLCVLFRSF